MGFWLEFYFPCLAQDRLVRLFYLPHVTGGWVAFQAEDQHLALLELDLAAIIRCAQSDLTVVGVV